MNTTGGEWTGKAMKFGVMVCANTALMGSLQSYGALDEQWEPESLAISDSPALDHYPNLASYLAHNGGQNTSASPAALDNSSPIDHYHHPP